MRKHLALRNSIFIWTLTVLTAFTTLGAAPAFAGSASCGCQMMGMSHRHCCCCCCGAAGKHMACCSHHGSLGVNHQPQYDHACSCRSFPQETVIAERDFQLNLSDIPAHALTFTLPPSPPVGAKRCEATASISGPNPTLRALRTVVLLN